MASAFNPERQESNIDSKIVVALERISEAFRVLLWDESRDTTLSPIQLQILIFIIFHQPEKCKVSYLANEFNMTKATISDSVKVLLQKQLIAKLPDSNDTRSHIISLTDIGRGVAQKAALFAGKLEKPLHKLDIDQKEVMLSGLLRLIHELTVAGIITLQRMCFTCTNYKKQGENHYCKLLETTLHQREIRIDCPEHVSGL